MGRIRLIDESVGYDVRYTTTLSGFCDTQVLIGFWRTDNDLYVASMRLVHASNPVYEKVVKKAEREFYASLFNGGPVTKAERARILDDLIPEALRWGESMARALGLSAPVHSGCRACETRKP